MASIEAPERMAAKRRAMPKVIPHPTPAEGAEMKGSEDIAEQSVDANARI